MWAGSLGAQEYNDLEWERVQREQVPPADSTAYPPFTDVPETPEGTVYPPFTDVPETPEGTAYPPFTDTPATPDPSFTPSDNTTYLPPPADAPVSPAPEAGSHLGDLFDLLQLLQRDVMELRGIVEQQTHEIDQMKQQSFERYQDMDRRLGGRTPVESGAAPVSRTPAPQVQARELPGEADAYRLAYSLMRSRQFAEAVGAFGQFLADYPAGRYAPNAHYWLGELYLVVSPPDLESARRSFVLLIDQYSDYTKVPDALYKLGKIHYEKGNLDKSREYLDRVIGEYGDSGSSAVELARNFLGQNF